MTERFLRKWWLMTYGTWWAGLRSWVGRALPLAAAAIAIWALRMGVGSGPVWDGGSESAVARSAAPAPPLYGAGWFDDSGYTEATQEFLDASLFSPERLQERRAGRADRALAEVERELAASGTSVRPGDPNRVRELMMRKAGLLLYGARFEDASAVLGELEDMLPADSLLRANLEAARGVAALRRGEIENCVACANESTCIFPLAPGAVHRKQAGSREAIDRFRRYLAVRPEDLGVRWLLNVAYMTVGEYPAGVPEEYRIGPESFVSRVRVRPFRNVSNEVGLDAVGPQCAGGAILDDFTNDGLPDIVLSSDHPEEGVSFLVNRGDGTFDDRSVESGLGRETGVQNIRQADFDNDGFLDIVLLRGGWEAPRRLTLARNLGGGRFADVTVAARLDAPVATAAADWADFDNDGDVDLFVASEKPNKPYPGLDLSSLERSRLYRNNGDGTFTDIARAAGVANDAFAKGACWGDYDDDGFPDLWVSNLGSPSRLYHNNGDGTFADLAPQFDMDRAYYSFGCWFWDFNNDGRLDLFVNSYNANLMQTVQSLIGRESDARPPLLFENLGGEGFRDITSTVGLRRTIPAMGCNYGDIDNDGYLDFYEGTGRPAYSFLTPNMMFKNLAGERFADVTEASRTGHLQKGHGVSFGDWDRDGDADILLKSGGATPGDRAMPILFDNPGSSNHWVRLRLEGVDSNRAAIGAKVRIRLAGDRDPRRILRRDVSAGASWGANALALTIGLGAAETIASLEVEWPRSRTIQRFENTPADHSYVIRERALKLAPDDREPVRAPQAADRDRVNPR